MLKSSQMQIWAGVWEIGIQDPDIDSMLGGILWLGEETACSLKK